MTERDRNLAGLGFLWRDGELIAPERCHVRLVPVRDRYQVRIGLRDGNALLFDIAKSAIKVTRETKP
jgi:hypothetical protein